MTIDEKKYLSDRVEHQIQWHDRKSTRNRRCFCTLQMTSLTCAALIPFISGFAHDRPWSQFVVGGLGVLIAIIGGAMTLYQFQKLWVDYRLIAETLRSEKYRFETNTAPYNTQDAFTRFVETVEATLHQQTARWKDLRKSPEGQTELGSKTGPKRGR